MWISRGKGVRHSWQDNHSQNPPAIYQWLGGGIIRGRGRIVGECLNQPIKQFPGMEKALFAKKDKLLNNVEIYLNHASAYPNELLESVKDGDEIHLTVMLTGGS